MVWSGRSLAAPSDNFFGSAFGFQTNLAAGTLPIE